VNESDSGDYSLSVVLVDDRVLVWVDPGVRRLTVHRGTGNVRRTQLPADADLVLSVRVGLDGDLRH